MSHATSCLSVFLLILFRLAALVHAEYFIDDSNTQVLKFSSNPGDGPVWGPFPTVSGNPLSLRLSNGTFMTVDNSQCYQSTFTYAACKTSDNCQLEIPFTGSGITIYVLQAGEQGMSANIAVDGNSPTTKTLDAPPAPNYYKTNVSLFDVHSLPSTTHTLILDVLTWNGTFSGAMFDYAVVDQTLVSASPSSSASPSATSSSPPSVLPSSSSSHNVGAAVGGAIGGVAVISLGIVALFWLRRRKQRSAMSDLDQEHKRDAGDSSAAYGILSAFPLNPSDDTSPLLLQNTPSSPDVLDSRSVSSPTPSTVLSITSPGRPSSKAAASRNLASPELLGATGANNQPLTDEQVDFVHGLYTNNAPVPAIARVLERMTQTGNRNSSTDEGSHGLAHENSMPPPSYDDSRHHGQV